LEVIAMATQRQKAASRSTVKAAQHAIARFDQVEGVSDAERDRGLAQDSRGSEAPRRGDRGQRLAPADGWEKVLTMALLV
jgi:hypothetical protein